MKKLPGKKKPPTLTEKETVGSPKALPADKAAAIKMPSLRKQNDVTLKRG